MFVDNLTFNYDYKICKKFKYYIFLYTFCSCSDYLTRLVSCQITYTKKLLEFIKHILSFERHCKPISYCLTS